MANAQESFVNVFFQEESEGHTHRKGGDPVLSEFIDKASADYSDPPIYGAHALRKRYPNHSLVMSEDYRMDILSLPGVHSEPLPSTELIANLQFVPVPRKLGGTPGMLVDRVQLGGFNVTWQNYEFIVYIAYWTNGYTVHNQFFILHSKSEDPARQLLLSAGLWANQIHQEIWVFDQGFWDKSKSLWSEIQKADWKDVILKDDFKKSLKKDIYGFFNSQAIYKELAIPWKRGLIMYGPPGNGKTISIKAIMKSCDELGFVPLYVKSFKSYKGEEGAMADCFNKARELSPCVMILEDLDSLINPSNRSFFLNQLDGLEGNDGLLVIGSTNHFDLLDPALSSRPSRFDRKYLFDDPDREERALYAKYWQNKLKGNKDINYSDLLVEEVAQITEQFSFAYLKEAHVSTLVLLAGYEDDEPSFDTVLRAQIKALRKQLDKAPDHQFAPARPCGPRPSINETFEKFYPRVAQQAKEDSARTRTFNSETIVSHQDFTAQDTGVAHITPLPRPPVGSPRDQTERDRSIRSILDALADTRPLAASRDRVYITAASACSTDKSDSWGHVQ